MYTFHSLHQHVIPRARNTRAKYHQLLSAHHATSAQHAIWNTPLQAASAIMTTRDALRVGHNSISWTPFLAPCRPYGHPCLLCRCFNLVHCCLYHASETPPAPGPPKDPGQEMAAAARPPIRASYAMPSMLACVPICRGCRVSTNTGPTLHPRCIPQAKTDPHHSRGCRRPSRKHANLSACYDDLQQAHELYYHYMEEDAPATQYNSRRMPPAGPIQQTPDITHQCDLSVDKILKKLALAATQTELPTKHMHTHTTRRRANRHLRSPTARQRLRHSHTSIHCQRAQQTRPLRAAQGSS